jgi:nitrite reductase/ring-hydroxylating ferredoxin subunit
MSHAEEQLSPAPDGRPFECQPAWRTDFPIDVAEDHYVNRRGFTRFMVLTSLAFVVGQFWIAAQNWLRRRRGELPILEVARLDQVAIGSALSFSYPDDSEACLLLRPDEKTLLAYNQKCTHLSCAVVPAPSWLRCPCHHGSFDVTTGRPLAGPPRRPLTRVVLEVRDGVIYATGVELRTV